MHSYWNKHQSPIKQLSGATNVGFWNNYAITEQLPHLLQVFYQQGDALSWWFPMPAGLRLPGWTAPTTASVYARREALPSKSFKFYNLNTSNSLSTFISDTRSYAARFQLTFAASLVHMCSIQSEQVEAPQSCSSSPAA